MEESGNRGPQKLTVTALISMEYTNTHSTWNMKHREQRTYKTHGLEVLGTWNKRIT